MRSRLNLFLALSSALVIVAACGGGGSTTAPSQATTPTATAAPMTDAPATDTPATEAPASPTVLAEEVGDAGLILVDAESGLTLYYFEMDEKGSGESACTGGCLEAWPALTVEEGETPTGGDGVDAAKLGTITRADTGELQVTYDGLPLYFFQNDKEPGDLNGVYENWIVVPA